MVVERVEERKKRRREEVEGEWVPFYTPNNPYLPRMDSSLAPSLSMSHVSHLPNPTDICL
jgi:hypothetical protein